MAAVNSVQGGIRLPLAGLTTPRVLMCSASMGAEGSVTLQLREAVQAPESGSSMDGALTIGYPDHDMLADMLGTLQAAGAGADSSNLDNLEHKESEISYTKINMSQSNESAKLNSNLTTTLATITAAATSTPLSSLATSTTTSILTTVKKPRPKTVSPTRHGPQQCQVCSKIFGNASALAKHKLTHSDERKYVCSMCSKAFKRQDHLNGHMLTHRNKKPYECKAEGCGKSYCDARSLRRHTENHHSALAMTPTTPNQSTTGPPCGLSLSPATASGDASSPHGTACVQYSSNGDSSKSPSPSSPAGAGNEGLTKQQLDLISQIMQQTKQANAGIQTSHTQKGVQRPRTWNMQTQLQQAQTIKTSTNDSINGGVQNSPQQNLPKIEQKPVECNLCHRKFKNIPALNGHMRLHGGYFKKDSETKKCDKKESTGPPLQTASIGVRALIEEKIINKRGKELIKASFVVPAPPLTVRRVSDTESFLNSKNIQNTGNTTIAIITSSSNSLNSFAHVTSPLTTHRFMQHQKLITTTASIHEPKDATLIELLKRGTKLSVKRACSDPGQLTGHGHHTTHTTTRVVLPNSANVSLSNPSTPLSTPPLALSLSNLGRESQPLALTISQAPSRTADVFTLAYSTDPSTATFFGGDNDVYSVNDTAMLLQAVDSIQLLHDSSNNDHLDEIASLSDYTTIANSSENMPQSFTPSRQLQAVLDSPLPEGLAEFSALHSKDYVLYGCANSHSPNTPSSQSPLPSPLAYPTPPASHEAVAQQASPFLDETHHFSDANSFFDDKKSNGFLDDSSQYFKNNLKMCDNERILQLKNELFNDTKLILDENNSLFRTNKNILDDHCDLFKTENGFFETKDTTHLSAHSKSYSDSSGDKMQDYNNPNLDFLDEPQAFIDESRTPLSAAFFSASMSSAEEVKEALQQVLPNENINEPVTTPSNDIDLFYLPGLSLTSQMMPNSDDPLLSSSPKDFVHRQQSPKFDFNTFCQPTVKIFKAIDGESGGDSDNNNKIPLTVQTEQQIPKDNGSVFLSPSSLSSASSTTSSSSPKLHNALISSTPLSLSSSSSSRKRFHIDMAPKFQKFKSKMKKFSTSHFTAAPMLNPQRIAAGLFLNVAAESGIDINSTSESSDTLLKEFLNKPKINIGQEFQARIPELQSRYETYNHHLDEDKLQWNPSVNQNEKQIQRFIDLAKSSAVPLGIHSEEMALQALLDAQGEVHIAILAMLQTPGQPLHKRWNSFEIEIFLKGLEMHGKDFYRIACDINEKATADCVQLYYFWKKLCVDYKKTHLNMSSSDNDTVNGSDDGYSSSHQMQYQHQQQNHHNLSNGSEPRPHVCEVPDCSASFSSKAALHGHTRIHCIGRNMSTVLNGHNLGNTNPNGVSVKDDFPCKVCGKVFNKVKSRSAHMKSHRPQDTEPCST